MFGIVKDMDEKLYLKVSDFVIGIYKCIFKIGVLYKFGSNMNLESWGYDEVRDWDVISDFF